MIIKLLYIRKIYRHLYDSIQVFTLIEFILINNEIFRYTVGFLKIVGSVYNKMYGQLDKLQKSGKTVENDAWTNN